MTDEYIVVVTTDESLVSDIQNATTMDVIHVINHDTASEKNYRRKIVILDSDTVETTQQDLSTWHENAQYLIVLLNNQNNDFIEQNQDFISDVWFKPINTVLLKKRLSQVENLSHQKRYIKEIAGFFVAEIRSPVASVKGYSDILLTKNKMAGELTEQQLNYIAIIRNNGVHIHRLLEDMKIISLIDSEAFEMTLKNISFASILNQLKSPETDAHIQSIPPYPDYTLELSQPMPQLFADTWWLKYAFERVLLNAQHSPKPIIINTTTEIGFVHFQIKDFGENTYSLARDNPGKFFFEKYYSSTRIIEHTIKAHGGEMWLEQNDDSSTFHFTIPIAKDTDD